ncbi:hypothetical protein [Enterococcus sp. AZ196]|uniref:hypothetical protein n=1 Tax=Enterococcus sp. AZ196 TaxID=2774659 RepID=UPI003D2CAE04
MMTLDEYLGKELAQMVRELLENAKVSSKKEKLSLAASLRSDAEKSRKVERDISREILLKLADQIESMCVVES